MKRISILLTGLAIITFNAFAQDPKEIRNPRESSNPEIRPQDPNRPNVNSQTGGSGPVGYEEAEEYNNSGDTTRSKKMVLLESEKQFVLKAASMDMYEIKAGKYAMVQSNNKDIKDFGRMMSKEHSKTSRQLEDLARNKGISTPNTMMDEESKMYDMLVDKTGPEFDKIYIEQMVSSHQKAVDLYKNAEQTVMDPDIKKYVQATLPHLQEHLKKIEELATKNVISGK